MRGIVLATRNKGKIAELEGALAGLGREVLSLLDADREITVEEDADDFATNAVTKAAAVRDALGRPALADDSGLEVDALWGAPGVRSARFGGDGLDDAGRNRLLLDALRLVPDDRRTARFRCALAYLEPGAEPMVFEGVLEGRIARAPAGRNGFGYDPVFVPDGGAATLAELPASEKRRISHRARAVAAFAAWLRSARP